MFQTLLRHPTLVLKQAVQDPLDGLAALQDDVYSRIKSANTIGCIADPDRESALQPHLGMSSESEGEDFWPLWSTVVDALRAHGMVVGPCSFYGWNDGDAGFVRTIWRLIRRLRPVNVVETGVAHDMTSRFILGALETIGAGRLWSIDLPALNPMTRQEVGVAMHQTGVPIDRWTYIAGTSRCRLPALLSCLGQIDLFIHDSMHNNRNVMFELEWAWRYLFAGGSSWSMTSTSIPSSIHSPGSMLNVRRLSALPSHCVLIPAREKNHPSKLQRCSQYQKLTLRRMEPPFGELV